MNEPDMSDFGNLGGRLLVIYDGVCGLCNKSVRWSLVRDRNDRLRYVPSDLPTVRTLLAQHGLDPSIATGNSGTLLVVLYLGTPSERLLLRSDAVLAVLRALPSPWPFFAAVLRAIPRPLRDLGYRLVARFRYRIWGHLDACPIPTAQERARFL